MVAGGMAVIECRCVGGPQGLFAMVDVSAIRKLRGGPVSDHVIMRTKVHGFCVTFVEPRLLRDHGQPALCAV